jgi:hypothetical protein
MRMKKLLFMFLLMCAMAVPASAVPVDKIVFQIDDIAVNAYYDASQGRLTWSQGGLAIFNYATGSDRYRVTFNGLWDGATDMSQPGGLAAASFSAGSFNVTFFALGDKNKTTPIADLSGSLFSNAYSYFESETAQSPSALYGAALIKLDSWNVPGYQWADALGAKGGLTASTYNLVQWDIADYLSDWNSTNTIVTILADETGFIPEPATICLLGLGAVAALRRGRRVV